MFWNLVNPGYGPIALNEGVGFSLAQLFADGTDGLWLDSRNLYQDRFGQTLADDVGEAIGLALDRSQWQGRSTLAEEDAAVTSLTTNSDNEASLFTSGLGGPTGFRGTVARSTEQAYAGAASAKYLCNDATNGTHYILLSSASGVGATQTLLIKGAVYLPTGSLARLVLVDTIDGSLTHVITTLNDQWVPFSVIRPAKGAAWSLNLGNNLAETKDGQAFYVDDVEIDVIPGNHGVQSVSGTRPTLQLNGTDPRMRFTGASSNLLTTLKPSAAFSMIALVDMPATVSNDASVIMGAQASASTKCWIGINANGQVAGAVGNDTFTGGDDVRGTTGVIALTLDGTTVRLYWNGAVVYSGAQNGSISTSIPLMIGALNDNGTQTRFADFTIDVAAPVAMKKALTAEEVGRATRFFGLA